MFSAAASSFDEWSAIAETSFVPLRVRPPAAGAAEFRGEIVGRGLDPRVGLSRIAADPCRMTRPGSVDDAPDTLFLSIQRSGAVRVAQAGRVVRAVAGEAVLYRSRERLSLECEASTSCLTVQVNDGAGLDEAAVAAGLARTIPASSPALRVLTGTADTLERTADGLDVASAGRMSSALLEMLDALLGSLDGTEALPSGPVALAATMQRFVLENLADPRMSVDAIARRFGVSGRYVTRVFADAGHPPPATFLRDERLRRAARLLEREPRPTVAAVATRCGFGDATTFARAFRRRFGMAPGGWARAGAPPASA
ncbi:AraC family transcriptional regulator [Pseudonocardia sp. RS11V-5]|uniref:AraC family transcriptional regulator n=1 Tax=Pseudonocardia terrae TaxID=2905831 RepID=UPI001E2FA051|nr:AraC family transcriptional regulator [Pseudonocardia terrae]MCE3550671.1 AraC family transcriptional regulator [Pseudonocardia terrae]